MYHVVHVRPKLGPIVQHRGFLQYASNLGGCFNRQQEIFETDTVANV